MTAIPLIELLATAVSWLAVEAVHRQRRCTPAGPADLMGAALAVLVALALDRLWGEPPVWLHPVV
jgi:adenosylcobinamide-phosphate synthase